MSYLLSNLIVKNNLKTKLVTYTLPEKFLLIQDQEIGCKKNMGLIKIK